MTTDIPSHTLEGSILALADAEERQEALDREQARLDMARAEALAAAGRAAGIN